MSEAVRAVLGKYAVFTGRARRSEYWFWVLAVIIVEIVVTIIDAAIGSSILAILLYLAVLVPGLAVGARRLHDTGKSGWWLLIALIPLVGGILLIVWMATDSTPGDNQYGPNPKGLGGMGVPTYGQPQAY